MSLKVPFVASLIALGAIGFAAPYAAHAESASKALSAIDTDHDGTIDMAEAEKAGMARFAAENKDADGTLDAKEDPAAMGADTDKDGTVDKAEYQKAVESAFKKADTDHEGTVDAKELASPAGEELRAMIAPEG